MKMIYGHSFRLTEQHGFPVVDDAGPTLDDTFTAALPQYRRYTGQAFDFHGSVLEIVTLYGEAETQRGRDEAMFVHSFIVFDQE